MKKLFANVKFLIVAFIFVLSFSSYAQSHKRAFSLNGGIVQNGFAGMATLDYKMNEFDYLQFSIHGAFSTLDNEGVDIPVNLYALNVGYFYDILRKNDRKFDISIGGGLTGGFESINGGDTVLDNGTELSEDITLGNPVVGLYAGIDLDVFLKPTIAINLKANETFHFNSEVGALTPFVGLGVKLILF